MDLVSKYCKTCLDRDRFERRRRELAHQLSDKSVTRSDEETFDLVCDYEAVRDLTLIANQVAAELFLQMSPAERRIARGALDAGRPGDGST